VKYFVDIGPRTIEIEVEERPDGSFRVLAPDGEHAVSFHGTAPHEASLVIDGRPRVFWFEGENGAARVSVGRDRLPRP